MRVERDVFWSGPRRKFGPTISPRSVGTRTNWNGDGGRVNPRVHIASGLSVYIYFFFFSSKFSLPAKS